MIKMNNKILNEEEFQEKIQRLQTILINEGSTIMELYNFVRNDNSYRTDTVELVDKSVNEALR